MWTTANNKWYENMPSSVCLALSLFVFSRIAFAIVRHTNLTRFQLCIVALVLSRSFSRHYHMFSRPSYVYFRFSLSSICDLMKPCITILFCSTNTTAGTNRQTAHQILMSCREFKSWADRETSWGEIEIASVYAFDKTRVGSRRIICYIFIFRQWNEIISDMY